MIPQRVPCFLSSQDTPLGDFLEYFVKIGLDLATIFAIKNILKHKKINRFLDLLITYSEYLFRSDFKKWCITSGRFPENLVKIGLDLAEIFMIKKILKPQKMFFKWGFRPL